MTPTRAAIVFLLWVGLPVAAAFDVLMLAAAVRLVMNVITHGWML